MGELLRGVPSGQQGHGGAEPSGLGPSLQSVNWEKKAGLKLQRFPLTEMEIG